MDKLRNLSVSSADFNYDPNNAGGSMPGGAFDIIFTIHTAISGIILVQILEFLVILET